MKYSDIMRDKGIELSQANAPGGIYSPAILDGNLLYISGQTAKQDNVLRYKGKVGNDLTLEEGMAAAELCAKNALAQVERFGGGVDNIDRIIKLVGYVNSSPDFIQQAQVINGASLIFKNIFGENGLPVRTAVGVAALPGDSAVEIDLIIRLKETIE